MILPDTNILIAYFTHTEPVFSFMDREINKKSVVFSVIAIAEFLIKATAEESNIVTQMAEQTGIIPVDQAVMLQAVRYRKMAMKKHKRVHLLDCFIAASAKLHQAILLTYDRRDYPFKDLQIKQPGEWLGISDSDDLDTGL